jgi:hypothetical protein
MSASRRDDKIPKTRCVNANAARHAVKLCRDRRREEVIALLNVRVQTLRNRVCTNKKSRS